MQRNEWQKTSYFRKNSGLGEITNTRTTILKF